MPVTVVPSNTLDFNIQSYYYHYTKGTGCDTGINYVCAEYAPYATYWAYSADAVYGKNISSVIINISPSTYTISGSGTIKIRAGCAPLNRLDSATYNIILQEDQSLFGALSGIVTLPKDSSVNLDITSVIQYASENYNSNWGLYIFGVQEASGTGSASKVTILTPTFTTLSIDEEASNWTRAIPYIYINGKWIQTV